MIGRMPSLRIEFSRQFPGQTRAWPPSFDNLNGNRTNLVHIAGWCGCHGLLIGNSRDNVEFGSFAFLCKWHPKHFADLG